jgi:hypothetical protein
MEITGVILLSRSDRCWPNDRGGDMRDRIPNKKLAERAYEQPVVQDAVRGLAKEDAIVHIAMCYSTLGRMIMAFERENAPEDGSLPANPLEACVAAVMMIHNGSWELVYDEHGDVRAECIAEEME